MGDGRSLDQAIRQLDKLIAERSRAPSNVPDPYSPVRRAYERLISGADELDASAGTP